MPSPLIIEQRKGDYSRSSVRVRNLSSPFVSLSPGFFPLDILAKEEILWARSELLEKAKPVAIKSKEGTKKSY